jgi:ferredoxin
MFFLKWLRVVIAVIVFTAISALFLDFLKIVPRSLHGLAHLQITPAILVHDTNSPSFLQMSVIVLLFWFIVTLLFGRIYCSTFCPFGILQDIFTRFVKTVRRRKFKFKYRAEMVKTRYVLLAVFVLGGFFIPVTVSILDPYSNFGRIITWIFRPLVLAGNNFLAQHVGGSFYFILNLIEISAFLVAAAALLVAGVLSALFGRRYCNTICPVGTLLGLFAKRSYFKIRLKPNCISCGQCEKTCKGECIDSKKKTVDSSRCVSCFNCLLICRRASLVYSLPLPPVSVTPEELEPIPQHQAAFVPVTAALAAAVPPSVCSRIKKQRRLFLQWSVFSFISGSVGVAGSNSKPDPSLPAGTSRIGYKKTTPIIPPGAGGLSRFRRKCTACHLCISKCPANVLTPATVELGLAGFLQPIAKFEHGFCSDECTICTEVCPSRALVRIEDVEKRKRLQVGRVIFLKENCVVETQGTNCGACAEHCPTAALKMVSYGDPAKSLAIPEVESELCIGCGGCEYICPVRPYRAIYVDGLEKHGEAKPASDPNAKQQEVKLDNFGF